MVGITIGSLSPDLFECSTYVFSFVVNNGALMMTLGNLE